MKTKKIKFGLLPRVIIAIVAGVLLGHVLPHSVTRAFVTFNDLFSNFLAFLIPLIIIGLVTPAIGEIGKGAGRLLLITVILAYGDTVVVGLLSYLTSVSVFPSLISMGHMGALSEAADATLQPFFSIKIPPMVDILSALIFSFILGLCIANYYLDNIRHLTIEFRRVVTKVIEIVLIPLLPLYIMGIFMNMSATGQARRIITVFVAMIGVIFVMHVLLLVLQYMIAGSFARCNPMRALLNMMPAYFTALGTSSSAATIPVSVKCAKKNKVDDGVAGFVMPLCATIHLSGSAMKITACAVALMLMQGMAIDPMTMVGFVLMLGVMMVAAPGVPGGAIMAAIGVLQSILGFDADSQALMIALYIAMDSFGTACNVTGDGAIALIINRIRGN